ncbi:unnamed protein product [Leptidea sinapis]|uniref:Uncharacterized protein n=1 Tax=Leptidea sinapis TaxID=189913 RepID=A0A5E4QZ42_9NEOP|nr:unnamed protein product [Leptidea sinapis]
MWNGLSWDNKLGWNVTTMAEITWRQDDEVGINESADLTMQGTRSWHLPIPCWVTLLRNQLAAMWGNLISKNDIVILRRDLILL